MRDTKLVFIEGLPGSGKTTTAGILAAALAERGTAVSCFLEDQTGHPLNVGGALHPAGRTTGAALFARYTPEAYVDESLQRWRAYVTAAEAGDTVQILESYPYQNSVRILLQMDDALDRIRAYASAVEELVLPLRPVLVYLERRDQAGALQAIAEQRGADWTAYATELITDSPVGRRRGLRGIAGALALMGDYQALVDELLGSSRLPKLILLDCAGRWDECHRRILEFLEV
jgi:hypothetical protein